MRRVFTGKDEIEANFVRGLLEQSGIKATVLGEMLGAARGEIPFTEETQPSVWINEEDAGRAQSILEAYRKKGKPSEKPLPLLPQWTCPECRERIAGQFTHCWKCGAAQPGADAENG